MKHIVECSKYVSQERLKTIIKSAVRFITWADLREKLMNQLMN